MFAWGNNANKQVDAQNSAEVEDQPTLWTHSSTRIACGGEFTAYLTPDDDLKWEGKLYECADQCRYVETRQTTEVVAGVVRERPKCVFHWVLLALYVF